MQQVGIIYQQIFGKEAARHEPPPRNIHGFCNKTQNILIMLKAHLHAREAQQHIAKIYLVRGTPPSQIILYVPSPRGAFF